jgi:hypothetical protein
VGDRSIRHRAAMVLKPDPNPSKFRRLHVSLKTLEPNKSIHLCHAIDLPSE